MDRHHSHTLAHSLSAAFDWWREAGVDTHFQDEPTSWLAEPEIEAVSPAEKPDPEPAKPKAEVQPELPRIGGDSAKWPSDLTTFREWWLTEPSLVNGDPSSRIAPEGSANAELMVLVPMPPENAEALSAGREGQLVRSFARAAGIGEDKLYLASALPRHMPLPDWNNLSATGLGEILQLHCRLAAPKRILVLGRSLAPLLGKDDNVGAPLLSSYAPERLLEHARLRAGLWRKWLDWTGGPAQGASSNAVEND